MIENITSVTDSRIMSTYLVKLGNDFVLLPAKSKLNSFTVKISE